MDAAAFPAYAATLITWAYLVSATQPAPYMDEAFHAPQAASYCAGDWKTWDPSITTFPGLYVWSAGVYAVAAAVGVPGGCTTVRLRGTNLLLGLLLWPTLHALVRSLDDLRGGAPTPPLTRALLVARAVTLPVLWFTSSLYYTDTGAVLTVCLLAVLVLRSVTQAHHPRWLVVAAAAAAVAFRQTNAVWVGGGGGGGGGVAAPLPRTLGGLRQWVGRVTSSPTPELLGVVLLFAAFVAHRGSVVLGHAEHHTPAFHPAMLAYLGCGLGALTLPDLAWAVVGTPSPAVARWWKAVAAGRTPAGVALLGGAWLLLGSAMHSFPVVHPFLLADNRHYTFYLWARVLASPNPRVRGVVGALLPLAGVLGGWVWAARVAASFPRRVGWVVAALVGGGGCLVLLPVRLLEPRYFITPLLLGGLVMGEGATGRGAPGGSDAPPLVVGVVAQCAVNLVTGWVFLTRPFVWGDGTLQRFMW